MDNQFIYTDICCDELITKIKNDLNLDVVKSISRDSWSLNDAMSIITNPNLILAVINKIDEVTVLEMSMLHFMCKPILVTDRTILNYPIIHNKIINYVDSSFNLKSYDNSFIEWFNKYGIRN